MVQKVDESANLDLLRAVAVLCVLLAHLQSTVAGTNREVLWHFGQLGVLMFFVHTSLVLMYSMDRLKLDGMSLAATFYIRRAFRIYPLSMVCVLCIYFWIPWLPEARPWNHFDLWTNLTLTQNLFYREDMLPVLWSLPLEIQMYIFLPFLFIFFRKRPVIWLFAFWLASIPIALVQSHVTARLDVLSFVPCFLGGVIAWRLIRQFDTRRLPGWLWPIGMAISTSVWMISTREHQMVYRWMFGITLGLTVPWFRDISWRPLNAFSHIVAKYSYGIYLSHPIALAFSFLRLHNYSAYVQWTSFAVLVIGLPVAMYHVVESPMIDLGRSVAKGRNKKRPAALSTAVRVE